jgi:hypothetical protein
MQMNECAAQRGFLMFRDCGNPASGSCSTCGRPMCSEHLAASTGFSTCLDCAARRPDEAWNKTEGREWAYGFRNNFYRTAMYAPIGLAAAVAADSFYDDYDVRSFDSRRQHAAALDEDEREPGFGDS